MLTYFEAWCNHAKISRWCDDHTILVIPIGLLISLPTVFITVPIIVLYSAKIILSAALTVAAFPIILCVHGIARHWAKSIGLSQELDEFHHTRMSYSLLESYMPIVVTCDRDHNESVYLGEKFIDGDQAKFFINTPFAAHKLGRVPKPKPKPLPEGGLSLDGIIQCFHGVMSVALAPYAGIGVVADIALEKYAYRPRL